LHPGRVDQVDNGLLNIKNPTCYVYPEKNHCRPGDHFTVNQRQEMEAFVTYKPFTFAVPALQNMSNVLSVGVLLLMALYGLVYITLFVIGKTPSGDG
jgi:hypothetical protein